MTSINSMNVPRQIAWFVRVRCRPDAADALADALAARADVSWVSITAGGGELNCMTTSNPNTVHGSVLLHRLPRTNQVLSFTAHCVMHMHVGGEADWLAFDDPLNDEQVALLHRHSTPRTSLPTTPGKVRDDDAPLLAALAIDGRAGVSSLAESTGWPTSRVSARLDELFATGAIHLEIDFSSRAFGFPTIACLWLTVAPGDLAATGEALSLHPETSFAAAVTGAANLFSVVNCRSPDELYLYVTSKVGALPAIRQAEVVPVLREVKQAAALVRNGRLDIVSAAGVVGVRPTVAGRSR